jgi:hypothetical protein
MTDLTDLLDRASDLESAPMPISADLARAHAALSRRRRNRGLLTVGSLCTVGVLVGATAPMVLDRSSDEHSTVTDGSPASAVLLAAHESAGPYTFGKLPRGWEVQGQFAQGVTIAQIGDPDQEPLSFVGKLVIMYDQNRLSGDVTESEGRDFYVRTSSDITTVAVATRAGEPEGEVLVQVPTSTDWDVATMIEFLDAVEVGPGARPGLG